MLCGYWRLQSRQWRLQWRFWRLSCRYGQKDWHSDNDAFQIHWTLYRSLVVLNHTHYDTKLSLTRYPALTAMQTKTKHSDIKPCQNIQYIDPTNYAYFPTHPETALCIDWRLCHSCHADIDTCQRRFWGQNCRMCCCLWVDIVHRCSKCRLMMSLREK